jgi:phenylalanyl-tRNA synthetase beta chain
MQFNRNHGQEALRVFEFGHVYRRAAQQEDTIVPGVHEHEALLVALSGPTAPTHWATDARDADLFDLKGIVEMLLDELRLHDATLTPYASDASTNEQGAHLVHRLDVTRDGAPLGTLGQVHPDVAAGYDLETPVFVAEFDWDALVAHATDQRRMAVEPVSRFPVVERDLAVLVHENQPVGALLDAVRNAGAPLLKHATVFDVYEGEGIEAGQKSVAFTLRFGADRTLTDAEVDDCIQAIVSTLDDVAGATLRE